eukprot:CAMPEP_0115096608 /NCGR_PEP_ID=MMETSP0227-20121206/29837_1 /TAXON_ID=89957 /ORGANISM="Polarella glacialis, Strain CCMP 1383" /LENGTH=246 /DNA_ID=CAMNT_0002490399 /DNA_START=117 /DNA_END=857 /DNA_ORIENTATION=+
MTSPGSTGHIAGALAIGWAESPRGRGTVSGHLRGGSPDHRTIGMEGQPGSGLHRGLGACSHSRSSPDIGTKFSRLAALKALGVPLVDMGIDVMQSRRHSPAPSRGPDVRNVTLQHLDAYEQTGIIGRRAKSPSAGRYPNPEGLAHSYSARCLSPRQRVLAQHQIVISSGYGGESPRTPDQLSSSLSQKYDKSYSPNQMNSLAMKRMDQARTMKKSLRRLDTAGAKLEAVAKALVAEAQRQSLKRVA